MITKPLAYAVVIFRTNGQHIFALESDNYDLCFNKWQELTKLWKESATQQVPFGIVEPVVTAFSPSMIYEISLIPNEKLSENNSANPNPYQQRGSGMFNGYDLMNR